MNANIYLLCETNQKGAIRRIVDASVSMNKSCGREFTAKAENMKLRNKARTKIIRVNCETAPDVLDLTRIDDSVRGFNGEDILNEMARRGMNVPDRVPLHIAMMCHAAGGYEHTTLYNRVIESGIGAAERKKGVLRKKKRKTESTRKLHVFLMYSVTRQKNVIRDILGAMVSFDERMGTTIELEKNHRINTNGETWQTSSGDCLIDTLHFECDAPDGVVCGDEFPLLNGFSRKDISDMLVYHGYSGDDGNVNTVIRFMENENTDDFRRCQKDAADFVSTVIYVQAQSEQGAKRADTPA